MVISVSGIAEVVRYNRVHQEITLAMIPSPLVLSTILQPFNRGKARI